MTSAKCVATLSPWMRTASVIVLLAGFWFFITPWVYASYLVSSSWNNWIVGTCVMILALTRLLRSNADSSEWTSWANCLLGVWMFASPWIYFYADQKGRLLNSACVGMVAFAASISSANTATSEDRPISTHT